MLPDLKALATTLLLSTAGQAGKYVKQFLKMGRPAGVAEVGNKFGHELEGLVDALTDEELPGTLEEKSKLQDAILSRIDGGLPRVGWAF